MENCGYGLPTIPDGRGPGGRGLQTRNDGRGAELIEEATETSKMSVVR